MKHKKKLTILAVILTFIILFFRELYYIITYLYNIAIGRTNKFVITKLIDVHKEEKIIIENFENEKKSIKKWLKNTLVLGVKIKSFDEINLFAEYFIKTDSNKWIIINHGYGANGKIMYYAVKKFHERGYNVVVPDLRGHGVSGANYVGMGWHDRLDIIKFIDEIIKRDNNAKIVLYGVSMGASTMLMVSGEKIPKNIKCIISDCAYTSAYDVFKHQFKKIHKMPAFPILDIVSFICKIKNGYSLREASTIKQIKKNKLPILFIHGVEDDFVPTQMVFELYKNTNVKKELLIVEKAGHSVCEMIDKKRYWDKIDGFLNKYLK